MGRLEAKFFRTKTSLDFASNDPKIVFFSRKYISIKKYSRNLTNFRGQTDYVARLGAKLFGTNTSFDFPTKAPSIVFPSRPPPIVFLKNLFSVWIILRNRPLTYFRGQTDNVAHLGAKLFRTNTSPDFPLKVPSIVFPKNTFLVRIFLRNRPLTYFRGQTDYVASLGENFFEQKLCSILARTTPKFFTGKHVSVKKNSRSRPFTYFWGQADVAHLGAKFFRMKATFAFDSKAAEIVFPKYRFSVRIFLRNRPLTHF